MREKPAGTFRWLDGDLAAIAGQWLETSRGEALLEEAVDMVSSIGLALNDFLNGFVDLHAGATATPRQRGRMAWNIQRLAVIGWLAQSGVPELNAAARAWQASGGAARPAGGDVARARAWHLIQELPELSGLRASVQHHLDAPLAPDDDTTNGICGHRKTAP